MEMQEIQPAQNTESPTSVVSVGEWFLMMLVSAIPLVGLIMLFVWAFGSSTNRNKSNFAKAALMWVAIVIVIYIIIFAAFGAALMKMGGNSAI